MVKNMNLKLNLFSCGLAELIDRHLENSDIDCDKIADTTAISVLEKICAAVSDDTLSDFDVVEEIVHILNTFNIDTGERHDF